jgi:predicted tellurium resistance membrane protein TerC
MLHAIIGLVALTAMEIVLGIDNIVFITVSVSKLPKEQQANARKLGLFLAMFTRILLLFAITWVVGMKQPIFELTQLGVTRECRTPRGLTL